MARQYIGTNKGQTEFDIVTGTASPGKDIEVNYDLTVFTEKEQVLLKLEEITNQILKDNFPPN